jgi:PAS domain S-box-containing protein
MGRPEELGGSSSAGTAVARRGDTPASTERAELSVEQFRLLAETSRDVAVCFRVSPTPGFEYVGPSVLALTGYTPEEFYADPELGFALVHPVDRILFDDVLAGRKPAPDPFVVRWQRKDAETVWVELRLAPFTRPDGTIGFDGVARDITAQKAAEETLRVTQQEEAQFSAMVASADEAISGATLDGTVTSWNAAAERLFGYTAQEMLGQSMLRLVPPEEQSSARQVNERLAAGGRVDPYETVRLAKDGRSVDVSISAMLVRDAAGEPTATAVFARDIGPRKSAEEAVGRAAERYRRALDDMLEGAMIIGFDWQYLYLNETAARHGHTRRDDVLGWTMLECYPGIEASELFGHYRRCIEGRIPERFETPFTFADGSTGWYSMSVEPVPEGIFVLSVDITAERRVAAERDRLVAVVEQTPDAIGVSDAAGTLIYANAALGALAGQPVSELVGRPMLDMMNGVGPERHRGMWDQLDRGEVLQSTWRGERPDGSIFAADGTIIPLREDGGTITHFSLTARDVTHLREVEADLALEASVRAALAEALLEAHSTDSLEDAVQQLCDRLGTLAGIDYAGVEVFEGEGDVVVLASHIPAGYALERDVALPATHAAYVRERATAGAWTEYWEALPEDGVFDTLMRDIGLKAMAVGPITHGDHVDGLLVIGTRQDDFAKTLVERRQTLLASGNISSALLAERLHARRKEVELRRSLGDVIAGRAFHSVFQPIVDLVFGEVVGYEALTRFDSGQRPDLCFAGAWSVGLGTDLELATLEMATADARALPAGRWLTLNMSARLLADRERLREIIATAGRPIVIEITEHEVIENYHAVRDAVGNLGHDIRVAVDDAGVGVANFSHIVELRPDLIKLDISLVRRVNADPGRQALVVAMRHFSRTAGCRLIAEGVETEDEARALKELGVDLGQGYWFGRPDRAETWVSSGSPD